jgi:hypothetical protein
MPAAGVIRVFTPKWSVSPNFLWIYGKNDLSVMRCVEGRGIRCPA